MKNPSHFVLVDFVIRQVIPVYDEPSQEHALDQCCSRYNDRTWKTNPLQFVVNGEQYTLDKPMETEINYISVHDADEE